MKPLGKRVVVREVAPPEKIGSIIIPYQAQPNFNTLARECEVVAVGEKCDDKRLKPGIRVYLDRVMPIQIIEKDKLLVVPEGDINSILED